MTSSLILPRRVVNFWVLPATTGDFCTHCTATTPSDGENSQSSSRLQNTMVAEFFWCSHYGLTAAPVLTLSRLLTTVHPWRWRKWHGIDGFLSQVHDGLLHLYASRSLSKAERRYCVTHKYFTRKELLAVVHFTKHYRPYTFLVFTFYRKQTMAPISGLASKL